MKREGQYSKIREAIIRIYEFSKKDLEKGNNRVAIDLNFEIGKRIKEIEARTDDSGYGSGLVKRLSSDLNRKYGKGFSERSLHYSRKFYEYYDKEKLDYRLSWSHYRALLTLPTKEERREWAKRAIDKNWNRTELLQKLLAKQGKKGSKIGLLERPKGEFYIYRIAKINSSKSAPGVHFLDLGCNVFSERTFSISGKRFSPGDLVRVVKAGKGFRLEEFSGAEEKNLFLYRGDLERFIDGDTLLFRVDLGFGIVSRQRLRLRGINSPEISTEEGKALLKNLQQKLKDVRQFVIKSHSKDKYGRYLVDVLYKIGTAKGDITKENLDDWKFLNNELLESGFAIVE